MIELSPSAAQEIKRIKQSRQQSDFSIQVEVKRGGCLGLIYQLTLKDSSLFTNSHRESCYSHDLEILIDSSDKEILSGLKIDFSEDLMGGGFRFYNPHASATCSCGLSFSPK